MLIEVRLARAARPTEQIRVRNAARLDGVTERLRDVLLPDNVAEPLRTVFACDDLVRRHASKMFATRR